MKSERKDIPPCIDPVEVHSKEHSADIFTLTQGEPLTLIPKWVIKGADHKWRPKGSDSEWTTIKLHGEIKEITFTGSGYSTLEPRVKISRPPGAILLSVTEFFCFKRAQERIFVPIVNDMRQEYFDALAEGKLWKAKWIVAIYRAAFLIAFLQKPLSALIKFIITTVKTSFTL